jgi:hypothetical protein
MTFGGTVSTGVESDVEIRKYLQIGVFFARERAVEDD